MALSNSEKEIERGIHRKKEMRSAWKSAVQLSRTEMG